MSYIQTLRRARELLEQEQRLSISTFALEFEIDETRLDHLVNELTNVQQVARREGEVLVWDPQEAPPPPEAESAPSESATDDTTETKIVAERRQLTVLFCDVVDSTQLAASMDIEDWRQLINAVQNDIANIVARYEGAIAQYLGDGVLIYFGFPAAHEDDAERAVRAALEMGPAVSNLDASVALRLRIGIHTGPVVVGEMGNASHRETLAMGETTHLASRLQEMASPGGIVISSETLRLVAGIFTVTDLGARPIKGYTDPVHGFTVEKISGLRSRLDVAAAGTLTPLIGREQELGLIADRWTQVCEGWGQVVLLSGEAGIGKSRLVDAFRQRIAESPHSWIECRATPYTQDTSLYPILELQRQGLRFRASDPADTKLKRIRQGLQAEDFDTAETVPLFAALHGVEVDATPEIEQLTPSGRRKRTLEMLTEWLLRLSQNQPLVLAVEDLHWIDPSSIELISRVIEQIPRAQVMLILTYRPDYVPSWGAKSHLTPLLLSRITRSQVESLVAAAAAPRELEEDLIAEIVKRSDGVPLFAEEITRAVLESSTDQSDGSLANMVVPATLQDSLMSRLDQLGPVKELAQLGSVLGREFSYELILRVSPMREAELTTALGTAVREELFYQRGNPPEATYLFKHALIRDAAYQSLLRGTRQRYHGLVARSLLERIPDVAAAQPELVAQHFTDAGDLSDAIEWWLRAGQAALGRHANAEAIVLCERGLEALNRVDRSTTDILELQFCIPRAQALMTSRGYASPDTIDAWEHCLALCGGERSPAYGPILAGLYGSYLASGQYQKTAETGQLLQQHGSATGDIFAETYGAVALAAVALYTGRIQEGIEVLSAYAHRDLPSFIDSGYPNHGRCSVFGFLLWLVTVSGDLARAREIEKELNALEETDPYALSFRSIWHAGALSLRRDHSGSLAVGEQGLVIAYQQGFDFLIAMAQFTIGSGKVMNGDMSGLKQYAEAMKLSEHTGNRSGGSWIAGTFAELQLHSGLSEITATLDRASQLADAIQERLYAAELQRLRGNIAEQKGDTAVAVAHYTTARDLARNQGAGLFALRACRDLAALTNDASALGDLRAALDACTGDDDIDLVEARAVVDQGAADTTKHNANI